MVHYGDRVAEKGLAPGQVLPQGQEAKKGGRSPTGSPVAAGIPTPSRGGGRREFAKDDRTRTQASALEEIMRRKGVDEAWNALEDMQRQGAVTDKYTVSRMLMKTVGDGRSKLNPSRVYRGMVLVERFIEQQPKDVDEVLFNALLDTCCRLKDLTRLESTVAMMKHLKVTPSPVTLGILVKTYGQAGDLAKVLQVWEEMEPQKQQANAVTYGCMIDACVKCGNLQKAVDIFQGMREQGKHKNTILYTTLIKGYGLDKDLASALALFREMPIEGVPYNTITYNSVLDACVKCGDLRTAESLLEEMTSPTSTLEPDLITYSTLLKGYCHNACLDQALQVCENIKARGLKCDELVYNTLMDGCVKAGDVTAGLGLFEEMVGMGLKPSAITHSILARLYQRAGYEEGASEAVAQLYQQHGLERPIGCDRGLRRGRGWGQGSGGGSIRSGQPSPMGSPMGSAMGSPVLPSPTGSQMGSPFGLLGLRERSDTDGSWWAGSAPPTPYGTSPAHAMGSMQFSEAMRGTHLPPLPGTYSQDTLFSNGNSACGSPCGSPFGGDQHFSNPFCFPPQQQQQVMGYPSAGPSQMPAWPLANGMPQHPPPAQGPHTVGPMMGDGSHQVYAMSMMGAPPQPSPQTFPAMQSHCAPFPMPLSPPHDLCVGTQHHAQFGPPGGSHQFSQMQLPQAPTAFFESWGGATGPQAMQQQMQPHMHQPHMHQPPMHPMQMQQMQQQPPMGPCVGPGCDGIMLS